MRDPSTDAFEFDDAIAGAEAMVQMANVRSLFMSHAQLNRSLHLVTVRVITPALDAQLSRLLSELSIKSRPPSQQAYTKIDLWFPTSSPSSLGTILHSCYDIRTDAHL